MVCKFIQIICNIRSNFKGFWSASFNFGNFVGPTFAGFIVETSGFRNTSMIFFTIYVIMFVADVFDLVQHIRRNRRKSDYEALSD